MRTDGACDLLFSAAKRSGAFPPNMPAGLRATEAHASRRICPRPGQGTTGLRSRREPYTSPGPNVFGHAHGVGAAVGIGDHAEEDYT
jgi:hypothetical protein